MQRRADKLTELQKPTADGTQENLLDRLETRISSNLDGGQYQ